MSSDLASSLDSIHPNRRAPGPLGLPLLGNAFELAGDLLEFLRGVSKRYGDVAWVPFLGNGFYLVNRPDLIEAILIRDAANFEKDHGEKFLKKHVLGNGLLTAEGEDHKAMRKMSASAFGRARIQSYGVQMNEITEKYIAPWTDGARDIHADFNSIAQAIVARTLFNSEARLKAGAVEQIMQDAVNMITVRQVADLILSLPSPIRARLRSNIGLLDDVVYRMIDEHMDGRDQGDLLSKLIHAKTEAGIDLRTDQARRQLRDECVTIYVAGFETTANALAWTTWLLASHPEIQAETRAEIRAGLAAGANPATQPNDFPLLKAVFSEALRLYPPAWAIGRIARNEYVLDGYKIPAGSEIWMCPYVTQRDSRWWPKPLAFDPGRWFQENADRPRLSFFPFGAGPRNCIGEQFAWQEATCVLATILAKFRLETVSKTPPKKEPLITLRPKGGLRLRVVRD